MNKQNNKQMKMLTEIIKKMCSVCTNIFFKKVFYFSPKVLFCNIFNQNGRTTP